MKASLICSAALGAAALLAACQEKHHAEAPTPRPVLSVVVAPQTVRTVGFAGTVEPRYKSDLGFRVLGRIVSRDVNVGDMVKKGQQLATLEPLTYQLAVRSAQADSCECHRPSRECDGDRGPPAHAAPAERCQPGPVSTLQGSPSRPREASVTSAKADLDKAREQLGYTKLRADFDGVVTAVEAELGQVVQPGQTVLTVARPDIREAVVDLPENIGRGLRPGARFDVALQIDPSVHATGSVREIAPQADPSTRSLRVRVTLADPPENFRLGTTITAAVTTQAAPEIELPVSALLERDGKTMVWVVDPATRTVSTRDVAIAARDGSSVRVLDGLAPARAWSLPACTA